MPTGDMLKPENFTMLTLAIMAAFDVMVLFTAIRFDASKEAENTANFRLPMGTYRISWLKTVPVQAALVAVISVLMLSSNFIARRFASDGAIFFVLLMHIAVLWRWIYVTGGSEKSPYSSGLLTIPTLGIFLREPVSDLYILVSISLVEFILLLKWHTGEHTGNHIPNSIMNIACFLLAVFTGLYTLPESSQAIHQLGITTAGIAANPSPSVSEPGPASLTLDQSLLSNNLPANLAARNIAVDPKSLTTAPGPKSEEPKKIDKKPTGRGKTAGHRIIDGRKYTLSGRAPTMALAVSRANAFRAQGKIARIIKSQASGYLIYTRLLAKTQGRRQQAASMLTRSVSSN